MNWGQLRTDLYDRLSFAAVPGATVISRLDRFMNQTHRMLLTKKGFTKLRRHVIPAACVANTSFMVLPQAMTRVIIVTDRVNGWPLEEISVQDSRRRDPRLSQIVTYPNGYYVDSFASATAIDPAAACQPFAVSTSASDGSAKKVFIEGIVTGGYPRTDSAVLNGVTPVALSALATYIYISKFYFQNADGTTATPTGDISLQDASGGNELSRIVAGRSYARYTRLGLFGTPSQANTYYVDGDLHIEDMAQVNDEPMLPEDWHWMLLSGAMMKEYKKRKDFDSFRAENDDFQDGLKGLQLYLAAQGGVARNPSTPIGFSQLGANFPNGS